MSDSTNTTEQEEEAKMTRYLADHFPPDPDADPRPSPSPLPAGEESALDRHLADHFPREER